MFLQSGSKGPEVKELQKLLTDMGWYKGKIDGAFGPKTKAAVIAFQIEAGLNADGVVGPKTREKLGLEAPEVKIPKKAPHGKDALYAVFGDPMISGYWDEYKAWCPVPDALKKVFKTKFEGTHGFWCNKLVAPYFQAVFEKICERPDLVAHLKTFDGCYNLRKKRGGSVLSTHSWAIAIDLNAGIHPMGAKEPKMNDDIVEIFEDHGFYWGGHWKSPDQMHFQFVTGY